jgi:ABC-2 type transport system permease protein
MSFFVFQIPLRGSFWLGYSLLVLQGVVGMSYGIFIASCFKDEQEAIFVTMPIYFLIMLSGGIFNPIESMPAWMQSLSKFLPTTYPCIAIRSIIARGWGLNHLTVQLAFLSNGVWITLFLAGTMFMLQFNL